MRYHAIALTMTRVVVSREKKVKDGFVLVPVMTFDSTQAAELWIDGQGELAVRGDWAGYADPKEDPSVMDQAEDTFNLG